MSAQQAGMSPVMPSGLRLQDYLGGESAAGGKLKETGLGHWDSPNTGATNESGFSGLQGGFRSQDGSFINIGNGWWSSSQNDAVDAWLRDLGSNSGSVGRSGSYKGLGLSIRCLRD